MDFLISLLQAYGYQIVFLGTLLEGETVVALAGFAAHGGHLSLPLIILVAIVGAVIGDQVFFYFGRFHGRNFIERRAHWHARAAKISCLSEKYQNYLIFGGRFMYGFRMIIPIVLGMSKVSGIRFFILNFFGAIVWSIIFSCGGYVFANVIESFLGNIKKIEGTIIAVIVCVAIIVQLANWWFGRKEEKVLEQKGKDICSPAVSLMTGSLEDKN